MITAKRHLAEVLISKGDTAQAEVIYRELVADHGDPVDTFNLAVVCFRQGEVEEALRHLRTAADSGMIETNAKLAGMLINADKMDEAMPLLDAAIRRGDPAAYVMRGLVAELDGDLADAEQWYRRAEPASALAAQRLAKIFLDRDDPEAAIAALLPSATDGDSTSAVQLAVIYDEKLGDIQSAEPWYRSAATRSSDVGAYKIAKIHADRGEDEIAERWLRRAVEDGSWIAAHDIGELMLRRGLLTVAEEWYRKSFELGHSDAAFDVGATMAARGLNKEAQYWWATALVRRGLDIPVDELLATREISVHVIREGWDDTAQKRYVASL
jgi:TPR repeat protein